MRKARLGENHRVKIIDKTLPQYFDKTGILTKIFQEPVGMKLEYRCLVKINGLEEEIKFAPKQLEQID